MPVAVVQAVAPVVVVVADEMMKTKRSARMGVSHV